MPRVLVVEDQPERQAVFRAVFPDCVMVSSYRGAVQALASTTFDEVWLDHDIPGARNGTDIAFWMRQMPKSRRPGRVVIHSSSMRGALAMAVTLRHSGFTVEIRPYPPV